MGSLYVIGIGNGNYDDLTLKAINILNEVEFIYCDEKIYNNFINFFCKDKIIGNKYNETSSRCNSAIQCALLGTSDEEIIISNLLQLPIEKINSLSTLFVGNNKTKFLTNKRIITPLY